MPSTLATRTDITPENKIIGFSGSPRKNGNSDILLNQILAGANQAGTPSAQHNLSTLNFKGCIGCEACRKTKICTGLADDMTAMYPELLSSKGLVVVSPTHNYNVTAWMKAFLDRLYCFYNFEQDHPRSWSSQLAGQGRKAVVIAICEQDNAEDMGFTLEAMKQPIKALGYEIVGELTVFKVFDKAKVKQDEQAMHDAYQLGQKLALALK
jgi:multimeric flavodoxin WrbA